MATNLDIVAIPMEEDGINLQILEEKVEQLSKEQEKVFLYTNSFFLFHIFMKSKLIKLSLLPVFGADS